MVLDDLGRSNYSYTRNRKQYEDWQVEAKTALEVQGLTGKSAAKFILSHLDGIAKDEIKYTSETERDDAAKVFAILDEAFEDKLSGDMIVQKLYGRRQREGETLRQFSHGLMSLATRAMKKDTTCIADKEKV